MGCVAISVGSVSVSVVPSVKDFAKDLRAKLVPQAAKIGDDIGNALAEGIQKGLGNPIADPLQKSSREEQGKSPKRGDAVAGAFARGFKKRLETAFKSLPEAKIDADSSKADRKVAELRARMEALSQATIGVDLDAGKALAETKVLEAELKKLTGRNVNVDVRVNAAAAIAELAAVRAEVEALDGATRSSSAGVSGMSIAIAGLVAVAPAVVPAMAAATAGVAGLGVALGAAGVSAGGFAAIALPMFKKVKEAQKQAAAGMAAYDKATTQAGKNAALQKIKSASDSLTVSEKKLNIAVDGLEGAWKRMQSRLQPEVIRALVPWIDALKEGMGVLPSVVGPASVAIGDLGKKAKAALASPFWHEFFTTVGQEGAVALSVFGGALGNVTKGMATLFVQFIPLARQMELAVARLSERFAEWARSSRGQLAIRNFIAYVNQTGPQLMATLREMATALINVVRALAPLAPAVLAVTRTLAELVGWVARVHPGFVQLVYVLYLLRKAYQLVGGAALIASLRGQTAAAAAASSSMTGLGGALRSVGAYMVGANAATVSTKSALLGLGKLGAVIATLAGVGAAMNQLEKAQHGAAQSTQQLTNEMVDLAATGKISKSFLDQFKAGALSGKTSLDEFYQSAKEIVAPSFTSRFINHPAESFFHFITLGTYNGPLSQAVDKFKALDSTLAQMASSGQSLQAQQAFTNLSAQLQSQGRSAEEITRLFPQYSAAVGNAAGSNQNLASQINKTNTALAAFYSPSIAVFNATTQVKQGFRDLSSALEFASGNLRGNTAASLQARQAFSAQTEAVRQLFIATRDQSGSVTTAQNATKGYVAVLYAMAGANTSAREQVDALASGMGLAAGASDITRAAFLKQATQLVGTRQKAEELWRAYKKIPPTVHTNVTANTKQATRAVSSLRALLTNYPFGGTVTVRVGVKTYTVPGGTGVKSPTFPWEQAQGGIYRMASGGTSRSPGVVDRPTFLFGEAGGEAFIPLDMSKRPRAEMLLSQVAQMFGGAFVKGGVSAAATGALTPPKTTTAQGGDASGQQAAGQKALNDALAGGAQQANVMNAAQARLNSTKFVALSADQQALTTLGLLQTSVRAATVTDTAHAAQVGRTTVATRTGTTATLSAGRATADSRAKSQAFTSALSGTSAQMGRTGQSAITLTGRYHGIPKAVATAITVNAKGAYTINDLGPGFAATGGVVRGPGTTTSDSIPMRLSNDEYVIRASAHRRYGTDFLHAVNNEQLPGFAKGGGLVSYPGGGGVNFASMASQVLGGMNWERLQSIKWTAKYIWKFIKLFGGSTAVVRAAKSMIGRGDDRGENNNWLTRAWGMPGAPWCFAAGTLVDTPDGLRLIEEIEPGDEVITPSGTVAKASTVLRREKPLLELVALGIPDTAVTEDHPYWTMRRLTPNKKPRQLAEPGWVRAGDLKRGDMIALPVPAEGDEPFDPDLAYVLGMYVADGHRLHRDHGVQVSDDASERERVLSALKRAGYEDVRVHQNRTCLHFTVYDANFYHRCGRFGDLAHGKRIPGDVFRWDSPAREAFLSGYLAGDGSYSDTVGWQATTVSRELALGLGKLVRSLGMVPCLTVARDAQTMTIEGRHVKTRRQYHLAWKPWPVRRPQHFEQDGLLWVPVRSVSPTGRTEKVYDLTVPGEHAFIADGAAVSNCAIFVSEAIKQAHAQNRYPGYPTAAVAGYNGAMQHVSSGRPGDLGVYNGGGHINVIERPMGGGSYMTIGGNQNALVQRGVRSPGAILRPRGLAKGGPVSPHDAPRIFGFEARRNADAHEMDTPLVRLMSGLTPTSVRMLAKTLNATPGMAVVDAAHPRGYDSGGYLPVGTSLVYNGTGRPEPVFSPGQFDALTSGASGGRTVNVMPNAQVVVTEHADVDMLAQRQAFAARTAAF